MRISTVPTADPSHGNAARSCWSAAKSRSFHALRICSTNPSSLRQQWATFFPAQPHRRLMRNSARRLRQLSSRAVQRSIQKSPRTLTDILYPVFLPAIRKSIGEKIDQTFQSLNETLRHIFTWHGLKWEI